MKKSNNEQKQEYSKIYYQEILPIFRNYEVYHKKEARKLLFMSIFGVILIIPVIILGICIQFDIPFIHIFYPYEDIAFIATIICIPVFLSFGIYLCTHSDVKIKKFLITLKRDCLPKLLQVFGDIKWFNGVNIIPDEDLKASGLFADFNTRHTDDEFKGIHNGVPFKVSEIELINNAGRYSTNIFKGVILSIKYNKQIKNRTIVARKNDVTKANQYMLCVILILLFIFVVFIKGYFYNWNKALLGILEYSILTFGIYFIANLFKGKDEPLNQVVLEDPVFCKDYNVYSSDQVEARYLVTTGFMERFQNLKTAFGAKNVKCSFFNDTINGDTLMFAIYTNKNLFEIGSISASLEDSASIKEFYNELSSIFDMIDYFKR